MCLTKFTQLHANIIRAHFDRVHSTITINSEFLIIATEKKISKNKIPLDHINCLRKWSGCRMNKHITSEIHNTWKFYFVNWLIYWNLAAIWFAGKIQNEKQTKFDVECCRSNQSENARRIKAAAVVKLNQIHCTYACTSKGWALFSHTFHVYSIRRWNRRMCIENKRLACVTRANETDSMWIIWSAGVVNVLFNRIQAK